MAVPCKYYYGRNNVEANRKSKTRNKRDIKRIRINKTFNYFIHEDIQDEKKAELRGMLASIKYIHNLSLKPLIILSPPLSCLLGNTHQNRPLE